jgi:hypothetical protein
MGWQHGLAGPPTAVQSNLPTSQTMPQIMLPAPSTTRPVTAQQTAPKPVQIIDFKSYIDKVLKIYDKYSSSSCSKEYDNAFDATDDIKTIIRTISKQASNVSFAGKQDAMITIVEICLEMLAEGGSTLSSEIRKGFYWTMVGNNIEIVLDSLSEDEMYTLQEDGGVAENLRLLKENAEEYALDPWLDGAIERLSKQPVEEGEEEEEEEGAQEDNAAARSHPQTVLQSAPAFGQTAATPLVVVQ